jgi:thiamine biosynthesis lipoprotein
MTILSHQFPPVSLAAPASGPAPLRLLRWPALGTNCEVQYVCPDEARARAFEAEVTGWVGAFESKYSRFRPDSLVSRINAAAGGGWVGVDPEMDGLLDLCASLHRLSAGTLDVTALPLLRLWDYKAANPRVPTPEEIAAALLLVGWAKVERSPGRIRLPRPGMAIDFGGWGKEYAVDRVGQIAGRHGLQQVLVDFGHDLCAVGCAPGKPGWHVGLEDPARPGTCWGSIAARDCGVACSGDYIRGFTLQGQRYGHIVDPRTGRPVTNGCRQVTVVARSCLQAGALSTTAFILGASAGLSFVEDVMGAEAVIITEHARHQTKGFHRYVVTKN